MAETLRFFVPGIPRPKGSLRAFVRGRHAVLQEGNKDAVRPWMSSISLAARDAGVTPTDAAVRLGLVFYFPRPKGHFSKKGLRPDAPAFHTKKPDLDKLLRAALDSLTGVAYLDDSQVVTLDPAAEKVYSDAEHPPGLHVEWEVLS